MNKSQKTISIVILIVLVTFLSKQLFDFSQWKLILKLAVGLAGILLVAWIDRRKIIPVFLLDALLSIALSLVIFYLSPKIFFDDAGFILRYIRMFGEGFLFSYNPSESPVFGASCFLFTLTAGLINMLHVTKPEIILLSLNFAGFFTISFIVLKLLRKIFSISDLVFLGWLMIMSGCRMFLYVATSGMETTFHIAIILTAIYFFVTDKNRLMWLFLTLSFMSKFDVLPIIAILFMIFFFINKDQIKPINFKSPLIKDFIYYFFIPLLIFILLLTIIYGSPLPHAAMVKNSFHSTSGMFDFRFFSEFIQNPKILVFTSFFLVLFTYSVIRFFIYHRDKRVLSEIIFGITAFASASLYIVYSPKEIMSWYYALPALLMMIQIVISTGKLLEEIDVKPIRIPVYLTFYIFCLFFIKDANASRKWSKYLLNHTEKERIAIGNYLEQIGKENDTLMAGHGHFSNKFKGYVLDISGLNSTLTTKYNLDKKLIIEKFKPQYIINHAWPVFLNEAKNGNYRILNCFYDITFNNYPNWILLNKIPDDSAGILSIQIIDKPLLGSEMKMTCKNGVVVFTGKKFEIDLSDSTRHYTRLIFGTERDEKEMKKLKLAICGHYFHMNGLIKIEPGCFPDLTSKFTKEIEINLFKSHIYKDNRLHLVILSSENFKMINPIIEYEKVD